MVCAGMPAWRGHIGYHLVARGPGPPQCAGSLANIAQTVMPLASVAAQGNLCSLPSAGRPQVPPLQSGVQTPSLALPLWGSVTPAPSLHL